MNKYSYDCIYCMKIILTETQYSKLNEVDLIKSSWGRTDVNHPLSSYLENETHEEILIALVEEYLYTEIGLNVDNFTDKDFLNYFRGAYSVLGSKYKKTDFILGMMYYISNKTQKIKKGMGGLDYFKSKGGYYYFFDPSFKSYIGFIRVNQERPNNLFPKDTYSVKLSMIETTLIGHGYGKSMYLNVINDVGCLISDRTLYKGSSNIWMNVLWKYVPSSGYIDKFGDAEELPLKVKRNIGDKVSFFFASKDPDLYEKLKNSKKRIKRDPF